MIEGKFGACPAVPHPRERDSGTTPPKAGQSLGQQRDTIPAAPCCTARIEESEMGHVAGHKRDSSVPGSRRKSGRLGHGEPARKRSRPANTLPAGSLPRGLGRVQATEYIGVSPTKFDQMVKDGRMPKPKRIDGRNVWDRHQLDIAFAALPDENDRDDIWARVAV
jgi:hypothetical protein